MAIRGIKLQRRLEHHLEKGTGIGGFRSEVRALLGLSENVDTGEPAIDHAARAIHPRDFSLQEVAQTFLGRDFDGQAVRRAFTLSEQAQQLRLQEAEGGQVLPSHFANISAFTDVVGGLLDAMILEAYQNPAYIGDDLMETIPARVQGGKIIGVRNDGNLSDNLPEGHPYPTVGLNETYVSIPDNQRFGNVIQLNETAFIYDRTGQIQEMAQAAGEAVRRNKELRQADCVLGKTNTYSRDGVNSNTYRTATGKTAGASLSQAANGTYPAAYSNWATSTPLNDWQDLNLAALTLGANKDPATGWEISINPAEATLLVMPHRQALASTILSATSLQTRTTQPIATQATAVTLDVRNHGNPVAAFAKDLKASWIWYNRLLVAGTNQTQALDTLATHVLNAALAIGDAAAKAQSVWLWGNFKRAFIYRQITPFRTWQAQLSSEDARRNIVAVWVAEERGVPFVREPRYVFQAADTYTA